MGYYQGCESAYTHVAACCQPGSPHSDQDYVCSPGKYGNKDYRGYDWFHDGVPDPSANHTNSADLIRDAAIAFIRKQTPSKPFFMYLPFQNIHGPYTCDVKFYNMYNSSRFTEGEKVIFGYITEFDTALGLIIDELKGRDLYDNTIVVFSSDNGAPPASGDVNHKGADFDYIARNYPYRGWKTQIWEGGMRVAGFVSGGSPLLPKAVRGTTNDNLFHVTDWWPTLTKLAGVSSPPPQAPLDGYDAWPAITTGGATPRTEMLYNINPLCHSGQAGVPKAGIRIGDYKLLSYCYNIAGIDNATSTGPVKAPANEKGVDPELKKGPVLYDLKTDPGERNNIAESNPEIVATLTKALEKYAMQSVIPMQWTPPFQGKDYYCADCPLHPSGKGPGEPWLPWL